MREMLLRISLTTAPITISPTSTNNDLAGHKIEQPALKAIVDLNFHVFFSSPQALYMQQDIAFIGSLA